MQLNIMTDYAIRMVLYLADCDQTASGTQISETMAIPPSMITTMSPKLRKAGIITTQRGTNGGYRLAKEPEDISLAEIINVMESTTCLNHCLEADHYCSRGAAETCPVREFYAQMQKVLHETFSQQSIASLMK